MPIGAGSSAAARSTIEAGRIERFVINGSATNQLAKVARPRERSLAWSAPVATCASPTLVVGSATKGARQPEAADNAAVDEVGNRRYAVARERQHKHSDGV